jgi:hypothetical protein
MKCLLILLFWICLSSGEVLAQPMFYTVALNGANEEPANDSVGVGADAILRSVHFIHISLSFHDLTSGVTAAHIHCCTIDPFVGVAGIAIPLTGFPTGVTSGTYEHDFNLLDVSTYDTGFSGGDAAAAEAALMQGLEDSKAYVNIHTTLFSTGEIRGFIRPVPEIDAGSGTLPIAMLGGVLALVRERRRYRELDRPVAS